MVENPLRRARGSALLAISLSRTGDSLLCVHDYAHGVKLADGQEGTHEPRVQERSMPVLISALKMTSTSAGVLPLFLR